MTNQQVIDTEKGRKSIRLNLLGVILIVAILCVAIIALAFGYINQQDEISSLKDENFSLWLQNNSLEDENSDLWSENNDLYSQIWELEKADLHRVDVFWYDLYPDPYINLNGIIFNSGTNTAYDVVLTVEIYDYRDVLIKSNDYNMASILGKDYEIFDFDIYCQSSPDHVLTSMTWEYSP